MKKALLLSCTVAAAAGLSAAAHATNIGINIGMPTPVVTAPALTVPSPVKVVTPGWYGERYYDGHRYWTRDEWNERPGHDRRHGDGHRHCPPGHEKKGEC
ncbi:hypothetical protein DPV79_38705 [Burkholderia reimsis]|uniref:DUF2502 domain-containing protein n=2 Tax=Burkholderia reimsis TaxID=2234132 RepID=A0A365QHW1_9BURK|nr:hypothetical protein [Burkholderia reimsis]RBB32381.1 hypothetical protein DPV79_38705 [Burkholderia reimsis]